MKTIIALIKLGISIGYVYLSYLLYLFFNRSFFVSFISGALFVGIGAILLVVNVFDDFSLF